MWLDVYRDPWPEIMVVAGRQTFKTTFCSDVIGCAATSNPRVEVGYLTDREDHLSAFSKQRLRIETFEQNPTLFQFLRHGRANIGEISLRNDSVIYLVSDEGGYNKIEGKALFLRVHDETQYQEIESIAKAEYTQFQTKGREYLLGIGGEAGGAYWKKWDETDQREWIYDDEFWRGKLTFDARGNITNTDEQFIVILKGHWHITKPENRDVHGYHIPQHIMASIPLTIEDAIHKYRTKPKYSIEHQERYSHHPSLSPTARGNSTRLNAGQ